MTQTDNVKDLLVLKGFSCNYEVEINSSKSEFDTDFNIILSIIKK